MGTVPLSGTVTWPSPSLGEAEVSGTLGPGSWSQEICFLCELEDTAPNGMTGRALPEAAQGGLRPQEGVLAELAMTVCKRAASRWQH